MSIGERITQERKRLELSQADFAKRVGVSLSSQKRYESGEREPDTSYLESARGMNVDVNYLLTGRDRTQKNQWVSGDYMMMFGMAFAKLNGITKSDLKTVVGFVETTMNNPPYRNLEPEESIAVYDEFFLIAVSDLLNRKYQDIKQDTVSEINTALLSKVIEELESVLQKACVVFSPSKKAIAVSMLYRLFKTSGVVDTSMVVETVALAG
jgi:transcriptional regulator with XRE-family HTH domain